MWEFAPKNTGRGNLKKTTDRSMMDSIDNIPLRMKIIAVFFIFIIIPLGLFTFIAYDRMKNLVLKQTLASALQSYNESVSVLERCFSDMDAAMQNLVFDDTILAIAAKDKINYPPLEQLADFNTIIGRFTDLQKGDIENIRIYLYGDRYYTKSNLNIFSIQNYMDSEWHQRLMDGKQSSLWFLQPNQDNAVDTTGDYFSYARVVYNLDTLNKPLAVFMVNMRTATIGQQLLNAGITSNSIVYLTDGSQIYLSNNDQVNLNDEFITSISKAPTYDWDYQKIGGDGYFYQFRNLNPTGLSIVALIPQKDITALQNTARNEMLLLLLIIASISFFLAYKVSDSSLKRIYLLGNEMKKIEDGSLDVQLKQSGKDEIGKLMESFNKMASRMSAMVNEKYEMGKDVKNYELKALQAQINPHFLYNSLDLINCVAIKHNIPEITRMVSYLADFYKLVLSSGQDIISIKDELLHVQLYTKIQNLRFENRITLDIDVSDEIRGYSTIKTILQPIVENSIMHGIFLKDDKSGRIIITAENNNSIITLRVEDDGVGMSEEKINQILTFDMSSHRHGYGIKNIDDRIKLYYGNEYGLQYQSRIGQGTIAEIRFPAVKFEEV
jgi:two-component system, sensor histidine kinase YesM